MTPTDSWYRAHLTDTDRHLLDEAGAGEIGLERALATPTLEDAVFGEGPPDRDPWVMASPFLTFAVAVHRSAARLERSTFVHEWTAPRQRVPVFDAAGLRELLDDPRRRFLLVELLASYTHVSSGVRWERTGRGWQRHRFSELDLLTLAAMLEGHEGERAGVYRRLGDLALFLTGVFPDHTAGGIGGLGGKRMGDVDIQRLLRLCGLPPADGEGAGGVGLLERLGARWYRSAAAALGHDATGSAAVLGEMSESFVPARRVLNVVTDWYLFPLRQQWFGGKFS